MQQNEETYYARYCRMGRRFQLIGGAVLAASVAAVMFAGKHSLLALCAAAGAMLLIFGTANLRPNNQIKAFATQLTHTADADFAQGLLEAITKNGRTLLSGRNIANVQQAIEVYAQGEGADEALVDALRAAVEKHLRKMPF